MSTTPQNRTKISGPGLKKEGVVVLQSFFIAFFAGFELLIRSGAGIVSGLIICIVLFGGIRFGRTGTTYVSVVTPPLAFAATVITYLILTVGISPSRFGLDFIASLTSIAPYLLISAFYGWFMFLNERAKARKPKPRD
jgi:hypothetical protein